MKRDNMLNHLAHTLPHWPTEYADMIEPGYGWAWYDEGEDCTLVLGKGEEEIRGADYLQRRTELINRPSWDDAPEWAEWLAQDESGEWFWFEAPVEMEEEEGEWFEKEGEDGRMDRASRGATPAGHDWRDTLEQRPDFDESRADAIGQNGNDGQHYEQKSWWTHKPCTLCERQTAAKVSDDRPVCPECVVEGEEEFDASFRVFTEQAFPKQERYQDASGEDWIDEFARTATLEEFRGAMRFTIGKYNRRAGKKDGLISEITKMEDYCRRWREYELARAGQ